MISRAIADARHLKAIPIDVNYAPRDMRTGRNTRDLA